MKHSIEWQNEAVNAAPEERATVGDVRIFLNEKNVTLHILQNVTSDSVTVALYGLINGLVHDWWAIFGGRDREISLRKYRAGYLIPDIRLNFDGLAFEISAHQSIYTDPDLRFWGGPREVLSQEEGKAWLSSLIEDVLARLEDRGVRETGAALRWHRVQSSYQSGELAFCEAAGALGLDPYQIADGTADFIERAEAIFERESLVEFTSGSADIDQSRLIAWVDRMMRMKGLSYRLSELRPIVNKVSKDVPLVPGQPAWVVGYRRARAVRIELGLKQHHRFSSFIDLARLLGSNKNYMLAPKVDGISALRREAQNDIHIHIRNHGDFNGASATHLFALARAIGDAACFPEPQTSPINRLRDAYRQAAGRAFAAEFLAPIEEIRSMQGDERDEYSIANEFGVSPMVIEHQIENRERIDQACLT
ncbi:hypothetical protein [Mesorhizobium sp. WSM4884]|uniref:ImmA/IrrE family metallo-endopeptidase n=1 Tax=Mesorhizobium sp. WSM4884 TaxID=3038542 RepID=UPI002415AAB6|nr:hypothetical protein [Mesorhizobium sp. WSM4884]MDG4883050.1 hypothetical protein [Mesorhizobium sp. WSM4884]